MRARPVLIFVLGVLTGVGAPAALVARARPATSSEPAGAPAGSPRPRLVSETARAEVPDLRPAIRASVAAVLAERRRGHELDVLLDELERAARGAGRVTAVELVTGLEAIEAAYPGDMEKGPVFARRMEAVQRELGQSAPGPAEPPPGVTVASLVQAIEAAPPGPERDRLVPQALTAIDRLPEAEQLEASKGLDRATAVGLPPRPAPPSEEP